MRVKSNGSRNVHPDLRIAHEYHRNNLKGGFSSSEVCFLDESRRKAGPGLARNRDHALWPGGIRRPRWFARWGGARMDRAQRRSAL